MKKLLLMLFTCMLLVSCSSEKVTYKGTIVEYDHSDTCVDELIFRTDQGELIQCVVSNKNENVCGYMIMEYYSRCKIHVAVDTETLHCGRIVIVNTERLP